MADKTTGELPVVKIGDLPSAADIYNDALIPVESQGEAMHIRGSQFKNYAKDAVRNDVAAAQNAALMASNAARTCAVLANDSEESAEIAKTAKDAILAAIDNIPAGGTLVINDLTTGGQTAALSAEMGKVLDQSKLNITGGDMSGILGVTVGNGTCQIFGYDPGAFIESFSVGDSAPHRQLILANRASFPLKEDMCFLAHEDGGLYNIFGEHNKPVGGYKGSGYTAGDPEIVVHTGGLGNVLVVWSYSDGGAAIVTPIGAIKQIGDPIITDARYVNGVLYLATDDPALNSPQVEYIYQCL